jgi:hypothetical protein
MIELKVGGLYSYPKPRNIYKDYKGIASIGSMEADEPFVFLENAKYEMKWAEGYKVLTAQGIVGWVHIGYPENIKEVSYG